MRSENISTPIYVECDKMYRSKVCVQEFWYIVSGLDIQPEQSENNKPAAKRRFQVARNNDSCTVLFRQIDINLWLSLAVVKASRSESGEW